ncbi:MAG: hypothetical protein AAF657_02900 [Acidobacteriota bacterium]
MSQKIAGTRNPSRLRYLVACLLCCLWSLFSTGADAQTILLGNAYYSELGRITAKDEYGKLWTQFDLSFYALENFAAGPEPIRIPVFLIAATILENDEIRLVRCAEEQVTLTEDDKLHEKLPQVHKQVLLPVDPECNGEIMAVLYTMDVGLILEAKVVPRFDMLPEGGGSVISASDGIWYGLTLELLLALLPGTTDPPSGGVGSMPPGTSGIPVGPTTVPASGDPVLQTVFSGVHQLLEIDAGEVFNLPPPCESSTSIIVDAEASVPTF